MDERDQASPASGHQLATEVGERVRTIISAAEEAANALRHEAEQTAAVRRRIGEEEAARIIEDAKADADAYLAERIRRIAELSDTVVERAETIVSRLDRAEDVRRQLQALADALGESAERLATEVRVGTPPPTVRSPSSPTGGGAPPAVTPPPSAAPEGGEPGGAPEGAPSAAPSAPDEAWAGGPTAGAAPQETWAGPPPAGTAPEETLAGEAPAPEYPSSGGPSPEAPVADAATAPLPGDAMSTPPPAPEERAPEAPTTYTPPPAEAGPSVAEPEGEPDVVRLDRREPPEAEAPAAPDQAQADEQLGARLVALQMAVAGGARGEVEVHLLRTFDLVDCTAILDDVFGPGTDADKRVAWPRPADGAA